MEFPPEDLPKVEDALLIINLNWGRVALDLVSLGLMMSIGYVVIKLTKCMNMKILAFLVLMNLTVLADMVVWMIFCMETANELA